MAIRSINVSRPSDNGPSKPKASEMRVVKKETLSKPVTKSKPKTIQVDNKPTTIVDKADNTKTSEPISAKVTPILNKKDPASLTMKVNIPQLEKVQNSPIHIEKDDGRKISLVGSEDNMSILKEVSVISPTVITNATDWDMDRNTDIEHVIDNSGIGFELIPPSKSDNTFILETPVTEVTIIGEETLPIVEQILDPVDSNVDKTPVTEIEIDTKYFLPTPLADRKYKATVFSFDYLSYLFFQINLDENLPAFYRAIDTIIDNADFDRTEDPKPIDIAPENDLDDETMQLVFNQIWTIAKSGTVSVKNLIGFYIYFNRRLNFLPILVQGTSLSDFFSNLTLESILAKLQILGLYPVSGYNLFERLWSSFKYSATEDANRAEIKLSLKEFISYDVNREMAETYNGFPNKNDQLIIKYNLNMDKYKNKKTFKSNNDAFKAYKKESKVWVDTFGENNVQNYLLKMLPTADQLFQRKSLISTGTELHVPNEQLFTTLQGFDTVYKINRLEINKNMIRNMFVEFTESEGFPLNDIEGNEYNTIWLAWVNYLNSKASSITAILTSPELSNKKEYRTMYMNLKWLTNAKFIIQYLQNNNTFRGSAYADGTSYIDAALLKTYEAMDELKVQLKSLIKHIVNTDKRFYAAYIK